jgi:hypothetical protein
MTAAARNRAYRARRAAGVALLTIEVPHLELTDALVEAGFLEGWDAESKEAIERAVERLLVAMIAANGDA